MRQPPGPRGRRITGNLEDFEADRLGFLARSVNEFGDVVRYNDNITIVNHPDMVQELLTKTNTSYGIAFNVFQERVTQEYTDAFMRYRRAVTSGMRHSAIRAFAPEVLRITHEAVSEAAQEEPVGVLPVMERVAGTAVARYCFGKDGDLVPAVATRLLNALVHIIGNPVLLPSWFPSPTRRRIKRNAGKLASIILGIIQDRRRLAEPGGDLLGVLLESDWNGNRPDDKHLCNALVGTILAGHRVPAAALSWMVYLLGTHPAVEQELVAEIDGMQAHQGNSDARSHKPKWLDGVFKESLRLYPPTWLNEREALTTTELGDYEIRAGQHVIFSGYMMHRDRRFFRHPNDFLPERWFDDASPNSHPYSYVPFGGGPRTCLGMNLSLVVMRTTLEALYRGWNVHVVEPEAVRPDPRNTLIPANLRITLTPRPHARQSSDCQSVPSYCPIERS